MGMSHCFFDAQDGRVRDMRLAHDLHSRFISSESHQPLGNFRIDETTISLRGGYARSIADHL
jgi:hypothetical protein